MAHIIILYIILKVEPYCKFVNEYIFILKSRRMLIIKHVLFSFKLEFVSLT